jgi:hypothetical protein
MLRSFSSTALRLLFLADDEIAAALSAEFRFSLFNFFAGTAAAGLVEPRDARMRLDCLSEGITGGCSTLASLEEASLAELFPEAVSS